ncbi:MAG: FAD-dependent oxidoreductase, partial [Thermoplasmata archaeon]
MEAFDVVVVGAGPAGALAARAAAAAGATTLLLDHRPELGHPV